jgi:hypothetical protein
MAFALICETLGPAISGFGNVVGDKFVTKPRATPGGTYNYGCSGWGFVGRDSCSLSAQFKQGEFDTITATRASGTALRFRDGGEYECRSSAVEFVFTGGGRADLSDFIEPDIVDTTGTTPEVATCRDALGGLMAASAAFAAMPPAQTFTRVKVGHGGEFRIDASGTGVVNIEELKLYSALARPISGYRYGDCDPEDGATLIVDGTAPEVVINVGRLDLGNCAHLELAGGVQTLLFNVPGAGRKIRVGVQAFDSETPPDILAPERVVSIRGGRTESSTSIAGVYARKLISLGYVFSEAAYCEG